MTLRAPPDFSDANKKRTATNPNLKPFAEDMRPPRTSRLQSLDDRRRGGPPGSRRRARVQYRGGAVPGGAGGVKLVIYDDHKGLKAAATRVLGTVRQRCRVHFMRNLLAHASTSSGGRDPGTSISYAPRLRVTSRNGRGGRRSTMTPRRGSVRAPRRRGSIGRWWHRCCRGRRASRARCPRRTGSETPWRTRVT